MSEERLAWDRRPAETAPAYERFRLYRDLGASRTIRAVAEAVGAHENSLMRQATRWDWHARAIAWDDECHRTEDRARVDAIRDMHRDHRLAGRAAFEVATKALGLLDPSRLNAADVARLLDLGSRLEQASAVAEEEREAIDAAADPWEAIARELTASG